MVKYILILILFFFHDSLYSMDELEIKADQFTYDKDNTRIYATGNVEIIDKQFRLYAQKVFLNNETNVLSASEDVEIFNLDGSILKAEKIVADKDLKNAIIEDNYLFIPSTLFDNKKNYLRLAAKKVERRDQFWEQLENGVFTACDICFNKKKNKFDEPLIQLRAKKIVHNKKTMDVKYYNTFLDFKGKSILYLPYFSHASPLVKRKAGFISPSFLQNHYFGFASDIPYYIPLNDHHDITIQPKFSQKKNPALFIEHRKNFFNGQIETEFSGTIENQTVNEVKKDKKRGHFKSTGTFDLNENSFFDFQFHRTTDRNYLNTYKYGYKDTLDSHVKLRSHRDYNFYSFESYLFQDLRKNINQREIPKILPRIKVDLNSEKTINSLNYETRLELTNLIRSEGNETKKFFINQNIFFPTIFKDGTFANLGIHLNAGLYQIEKYTNPKNGRFEFNEYKHNFYPQITLALSKPYFKKTKKYKTIIEPHFLFVKSNANAFNKKIPDESNINNFDLDYFDLFHRNRLSGSDRADSITRFDYGLSLQKKSILSELDSKIVFAQSYQLENHKYLPENSGIKDKFSDILGNVEVSPIDAITLSSFFSIDKDNLALKNAYSTLLFRQKKTYFSIRNIHGPAIIKNDGTNMVEAKNQFTLALDQKFSEYWTFTTSTTFDKKSEIKFHNIETKIKYEDECLGISLNWKRQYTHNPEDPTSNSFLFLFSLKEILENDI